MRSTEKTDTLGEEKRRLQHLETKREDCFLKRRKVKTDTL